MAVIVVVVGVIALERFKLTRGQIFETNRARIETVIRGLESGGMENDELIDEYDQLYIAKLKNTWYYYDNLRTVVFDDSFARDAAEYAGVQAAAVIDGDGNTFAAYNCSYDFARKRFRMLREQLKEDGTSEPFSIHFEEGVERFYGIRLRSGRILVFVVDWTETERSIETMTSWEALGENYEGLLSFGGDDWCAVGKQWNDAVVFVMTRTTADLTDDLVLIVFIAIIFIIFVLLVSVYATIINRDNIRIGRMPRYITLLKGRFFFNITVAEKLSVLVILGIVATTGLS